MVHFALDQISTISGLLGHIPMYINTHLHSYTSLQVYSYLHQKVINTCG